MICYLCYQTITYSLTGEDYEAARQQHRSAKQAGLLAQIRSDAEYAERDAHAMAKEMFNCELDQITESQGWE
jgi:hypothetical protein